MPLVRKVISIGKTSRAVIIPKSWLRDIEDKSGETIKKLALEVDGCITIRPIIDSENKKETR